jgi:hypothetical protein
METPHTNTEPEIVYVALDPPGRDAEALLSNLLSALEAIESPGFYPQTALPVIDINE